MDVMRIEAETVANVGLVCPLSRNSKAKWGICLGLTHLWKGWTGACTIFEKVIEAPKVDTPVTVRKKFSK